jgi:peptidylprolyl isomerase
MSLICSMSNSGVLKRLVPVVLSCVALALFGCGGGSSKEATTSGAEAGSTPAKQRVAIGQIPNLSPARQSTTTSAKAIAKRPEPKVVVPKGPPPKKLLVGDLLVGSGPPIETGDRVGLRWVAYSYETGQKAENSWTLTRDTKLGAGEVNEGWEHGLPGMKVGGLRELIVPTDLTRFGEEPLLYVVSLVWVK